MPLLILTQCSSIQNFTETKPTEPVIVEQGANFCQIAKPICPVKEDTYVTQVQIEVHNEKGKALKCPNWNKQSCIKVTMSPVVP